MNDLYDNVRGRRSAPRLYPLQPLIDVAKEASDSVLAVKLGIGGYTLAIARAEGLTETQADRWAVRCGWHPSNIWPEWYALAPAWTPDELEESAA